ncbi:hypothetical protein HMPREF3034_00627 [Prevotella sp. DNF00663]|nr:hypothetical protein HMPREF3034_00627 [Prevotella sp. DNF00663]
MQSLGSLAVLPMQYRCLAVAGILPCPCSLIVDELTSKQVDEFLGGEW